MRRSPIGVAGLVLAATLVLGSCGGSSSKESGSTSASTVGSSNGSSSTSDGSATGLCAKIHAEQLNLGFPGAKFSAPRPASYGGLSDLQGQPLSGKGCTFSVTGLGNWTQADFTAFTVDDAATASAVVQRNALNPGCPAPMLGDTSDYYKFAVIVAKGSAILMANPGPLDQAHTATNDYCKVSKELADVALVSLT